MHDTMSFPRRHAPHMALVRQHPPVDHISDVRKADKTYVVVFDIGQKGIYILQPDW
jgi:hypothetical protein